MDAGQHAKWTLVRLSNSIVRGATLGGLVAAGFLLAFLARTELALLGQVLVAIAFCAMGALGVLVGAALSALACAAGFIDSLAAFARAQAIAKIANLAEGSALMNRSLPVGQLDEFFRTWLAPAVALGKPSGRGQRVASWLGRRCLALIRSSVQNAVLQRTKPTGKSELSLHELQVAVCETGLELATSYLQGFVGWISFLGWLAAGVLMALMAALVASAG
jgi:hypothetical protein